MQHERGKGFIHLKQINVLNGQARQGQGLFGGLHCTRQGQGAVHAHRGGGQDAGAGFEPQALCSSRAGEQNGRGTIGHGGGVACVLHMVDVAQAIALAHDLVDAVLLGHGREGGGQLAQCVECGLRPGRFILSQQHSAIGTEYGCHGLVAALLQGGHGTLLGSQGVGVTLGAVKTFDRGNGVG